MRPHVASDWERVVLVCRKCSKRQHGGFGPDGETRLAKALRRAVGGGKGRRARIGVVEVGCLGVCPKHAVVAVDAAAPGEWLLVRPGTPLEDVAERLGLDRPDRGPTLSSTGTRPDRTGLAAPRGSPAG